MKTRSILFGLVATFILVFGSGMSFAIFYAGENIDMLGSKVINLGTPTADQDGATKAYVDGAEGAVTFEGVTTATYVGGRIGGAAGGNEKCQADFPGSRMCSVKDLLRSGNTSTTSKGWVFSDASAESSCASFTNRSLNSVPLTYERYDIVTYTGTHLRMIKHAIRDDGTVAFIFENNSDPYLYSCANVECTSGNSSQLDSAALDGLSIAIGEDGLPDIAVDDGANLEFLDCSNYDCSSFTRRTVSTQNALWTSIQTSSGTGFPLIAFEVGATLRMYECLNAACSSGNDYLVFDSSTVDFPLMQLQSDGNPYIVYDQNDRLGVVRCINYNCTDTRTYSLPGSYTNPAAGAYNFILSDDDLPIIATVDDTPDGGQLVFCLGINCRSSYQQPLILSFSSIAIVAEAPDGLPVLFTGDIFATYVIKCLDRFCTESKTITLTGQGDLVLEDYTAFLNSEGNVQLIGAPSGSGATIATLIFPLDSLYTGPMIDDDGMRSAYCEEQAGIACCS